MGGGGGDEGEGEGGGGKEKTTHVGVQNLGMLGLSVPKPLIITIHQGKCLSPSVSKLTFFIIIIIYRGVTGMLITLVLLIFSALDVLFFFLPTANFDSRVVR